MGSGPIGRETLRLYYRIFVPLLSADNDGSSKKLEYLVNCKGRTLKDEELANLKAAQLYIKRIMLYLTDPKNSTVHIIQEYISYLSQNTLCSH